ncbi:MAG TPA: universal stress protein [Thermoanaerobaculia bacterium]|nr:universal stress protein [Thermoanaerobaculia bacterium]
MKFHPRRILVPVDLEESSEVLLRYALQFASHFGAKITVVHADPTPGYTDYPYFTTQQLEQRWEEELSERAHTLEELIARSGNPVGVDWEVLRGFVIPVLLERIADGFDLVILGTHGRRGLSRIVFGSVAAQILRLADVPVLTIRAGVTELVTRRVLCPVDLGLASAEALRIAAGIAERFDATLIVLQLVEPGELTEVGAEKDRLQRWVSQHCGAATDLRVLVRGKEAAEQVLHYAKEQKIELIVLGSPRSAGEVPSMENAAAEIVRKSECPVLTVHPSWDTGIAEASRAIAKKA